jgi:hypothetical protein
MYNVEIRPEEVTNLMAFYKRLGFRRESPNEMSMIKNDNYYKIILQGNLSTVARNYREANFYTWLKSW